MIDCDFCGAATRLINHCCTQCGKPMLADWYTDEQGNVRQMCVTAREKTGQDRSGSANK